jgi:hypothetical protein
MTQQARKVKWNPTYLGEMSKSVSSRVQIREWISLRNKRALPERWLPALGAELSRHQVSEIARSVYKDG